jgi:hypothetical protein
MPVTKPTCGPHSPTRTLPSKLRRRLHRCVQTAGAQPSIAPTQRTPLVRLTDFLASSSSRRNPLLTTADFLGVRHAEQRGNGRKGNTAHGHMAMRERSIEAKTSCRPRQRRAIPAARRRRAIKTQSACSIRACRLQPPEAQLHELLHRNLPNLYHSCHEHDEYFLAGHSPGLGG